jgi:hypothetical protein
MSLISSWQEQTCDTVLVTGDKQKSYNGVLGKVKCFSNTDVALSPPPFLFKTLMKPRAVHQETIDQEVASKLFCMKILNSCLFTSI